MLAVLVGCTAPPADPAEGRAIVLDAERRLVHVAERELLWRTAKTATNPRDVASAVVLGLEVDHDRFAPLIPQLAATDDPEVLATLADRVDRDQFGPRAELLAVRARYANGAGPWPSVDRVRGARVLAGVLAEYVVDPPIDRMTAGTARRYADLWTVRTAFPTWTREPVGESPQALIDDAVAAGLPEPVAVGEGVEAALAALDRYTVPVWPTGLTGWKEHHAGASTGIGVEMTTGADGAVLVAMPAVGGPAWNAGVHAGDRVVNPTGDLTAVAAALAGEPGTAAALTVDRGGEPVQFTIVRAEVPEETVRGWQRTATGWDPWEEPGIAVVHITAFRPHTDEELDALLPGPADAVVMDLRGNGGGDVMAAVEVADRFVADGELAFLGGRAVPPPATGPNGELPWNVAVPGNGLEGAQVVVLVDRRTASAAELVAGALRERVHAVLVGDRTYGKGLAQALRVDEALGVGWQVTNGTWMLPSRTALEQPGGERTGLVPDVMLALSPAERLQIEQMRRVRELPKVHPDGTPVPDLGLVSRSDVPRLDDDPQMVEALRIARSARPAPELGSGPAPAPPP